MHCVNKLTDFTSQLASAHFYNARLSIRPSLNTPTGDLTAKNQVITELAKSQVKLVVKKPLRIAQGLFAYFRSTGKGLTTSSRYPR